MNKQTISPKRSQYMMRHEKNDIIDLILEDHKEIKRLIKILKGDADFNEKFIAFDEFAPVLTTHAKSEEQSLYTQLKKYDDEEIREFGFEGDVEHGIADQLVEELKRDTNEDSWMAKVKVLAELVEHHVEEEEEETLPNYKKASDEQERIRVAGKYLKFKAELEEKGGEDAPSEESSMNH